MVYLWYDRGGINSTDLPLAYQIKVFSWYVICMFLVCDRSVIAMSSHTFDITYTYQKHTHNLVWALLKLTRFKKNSLPNW